MLAGVQEITHVRTDRAVGSGRRRGSERRFAVQFPDRPGVVRGEVFPGRVRPLVLGRAVDGDRARRDERDELVLVNGQGFRASRLA